MACAPKSDPLATAREALGALPPLPPSWAAEASVVLDQELVASWIADEVATELAEVPGTLRLDGGALGALDLLQELAVGTVEVAAREGRLAVTTPVEGEVEVVLETLLGTAVETLAWTGAVICTYEVVLEDSRVVARPHLPETWGLTLVLGDRSDALDGVLGALLEEGLQAALTLDPPQPYVVAELPERAVRGLRLRPLEDHLVLEFAFEGLLTGQVGEVPSPEGGWVAVVPEQTALSVARAAVLREPPAADIVEPMGLQLRPDHFRLEVRQHLEAGPVRRRFYGMRGRLELVDGSIVARPQGIDVLGGAMRAPLGEDHRFRLLGGLSEALTVSVPARTTTWVAGEQRDVVAERIETRDGQLLVYGAVTPP